MIRRITFWVLALLLLSIMLPRTVNAEEVTLSWDANSESDLAGYKVYWGISPRNYSNVITVPGVPSYPTYTILGLVPRRYYFAVTAYNTDGLESGFSNEVTTADLNRDARIDVLDLQIMLNAIQGVSPNVWADFNGDGATNVLDLQMLIGMLLSGG